MHLGFDADSAVISAPSSPDGAAQRPLCLQTASLRAIAPSLVGFQGLAFLRGGISAWESQAAIASWHLRVS